MSISTNNNTPMSRRGAQSVAMVALLAALVAVLGLVPKLDMPLGVHLTLQNLGVMLAGCLLGAWRGLQAMLLFLLAVAVGLPLLAGGRGGIGMFMVPSSGYLLGFAVGAWTTGYVMGRLPRSTPRQALVSAFIASVVGGILVMHAMGIGGLMLLANMSLQQAVLVDVVFVPGDLIKCAVCAVVVQAVAKALPDWPLGGRSV